MTVLKMMFGTNNFVVHTQLAINWRDNASSYPKDSKFLIKTDPQQRLLYKVFN